MFEQLAAENGYEKLSMICADSNPAIYLYERLGYQKEKMLSTWYTTRDKKRDLYEQENKQ
jgi:ribosomal protein S18 acetylase RimI-like enzyme